MKKSLFQLLLFIFTINSPAFCSEPKQEKDNIVICSLNNDIKEEILDIFLYTKDWINRNKSKFIISIKKDHKSAGYSPKDMDVILEALKKAKNWDSFNSGLESIILFFDTKKDIREFVSFSFHKNGKIKSFYTGSNGSVTGDYLVWDSNGSLEMKAKIISGIPFINEKFFDGDDSWKIDGKCYCWQDGKLVSDIDYKSGKVDGSISTCFSSNSCIKTETHYKNNVIDGCQTVCALKDFKIGDFQVKEKDIISKETYKDGKLLNGEYLIDPSSYFVKDGNGKAFRILETVEVCINSERDTRLIIAEIGISNGMLNGKSQTFSISKGIKTLNREASFKDGKLNGEDAYYKMIEDTLVKIKAIIWDDGSEIEKQEFFDNGMIRNRFLLYKSGLVNKLESYNKNGQILVDEEFDQDENLITGLYYNDNGTLISSVKDGVGEAIYRIDADTAFKVKYSGKGEIISSSKVKLSEIQK